MSLYQYQHDALKRLREMFLSVAKVCLAAACGAGKTFVAIKYIADYLTQNPGAKILVLAHGQTVLRTQFFHACEEFETVCEKLPVIFRSALVQKASDLKKYYDTHNVIVTIPQSIQQLKKMPRFDLIVVDEGHQFYFAYKGMVQRIIRKAKVKQELALTGTPSPFISHKWPIIPIPMNTLLPDYVEDVIVELAASSYLTKFDDYDLQAGEIKGKNHNRILTKKATEDTLDSLLQFIHKRARSMWKKHPSIANALIKAPDWLVAFKVLQKTMIACKSQKQARDVKAYFEAKGIKTLISISDDQDSKSAQDTFDRFKSDPDALILVVVGRGILGFNYPDLANVVDMTCSINIDRVFQLMSRAVRKSKKVKQKLFLKIVPDMFEGYKGLDYFHHMMTAVMSLTDEYWFTHYDKTNFLQLKIPSTRTRSGSDHTKRPSRKKRLPVAPCWLGLPAVEFFKKLWHRDRKGHYSYEFTTLGIVRQRLLDCCHGTKEALLERSLEMTEQCAQVYQDTGRLPSLKTPLGRWLHRMISMRYNPNPKKGVFPPQLMDRAKSLGVPFMFDRQDDKRLSKLRDLLDQMGSEGIPQKGDPFWKFFHHMKEEYNDKSTKPMKVILKEEIDGSGLSRMFQGLSVEEKRLQKAKIIVKCLRQDGACPSGNHPDPEIREAVRYLKRLRMMYNKTTLALVGPEPFPSEIELFEKAGVLWVLQGQSMRRLQPNFDKCISFRNEKDYWPQYTQSDKEQFDLAVWRGHLKQDFKKGKLKQQVVEYIVSKCPYFFEEGDNDR